MNTSRNRDWWHNKRVLVTGGSGFLGSHVAELLLPRAARVSITARSTNLSNIAHLKKELAVIKGDLTDPVFANEALASHDVVIHLAARVAGIQYNIDHPVEMFNDTLIMGKNVLEASKAHNVQNILMVSSACVYPRHCTIPTPENEGFIDDPEPTNLGYGWAKRVLELMARFYHDEYDMKITVARPYNLYGPRDTFDPAVSHVIPGIIKRVFDGEDPLTVWGTGTQTRSFLYVKDCAEMLIRLVERSQNAQPINVGTDEEITIADLTKMIISLSGKQIALTFDRSKPDGHPRRRCDIRLMQKTIQWKKFTPLTEGLKKTVEWYKNHH